MNEALGDDVIVALRRSMGRLVERHSIRDLDDALSEIVAAAVDLVPGAAGGGISRTENGVVSSSHASDEVVARLDALQSVLRQGPCIDAAAEPPEDGVVVAVDLAGADGERWPQFAPKAVELGYRSMVSTHLTTRRGGPQSALNLYGTEAHAFDHQARNIAGTFAVQAAAVLYGVDEARTMDRALVTRDVIGQAKGILMERFALSDIEAFDMLVTSSQETNVKLVNVANWLVGEALQQSEKRDRPGEGVMPRADRS